MHRGDLLWRLVGLAKIAAGSWWASLAAAKLPHTIWTMGTFMDYCLGVHGQPVDIEGLWALRFGNGAGAGPTTTLFFTAGIDDEAHGLFGKITPIPHDEDDND